MLTAIAALEYIIQIIVRNPLQKIFPLWYNVGSIKFSAFFKILQNVTGFVTGVCYGDYNYRF